MSIYINQHMKTLLSHQYQLRKPLHSSKSQLVDQCQQTIVQKLLAHLSSDHRVPRGTDDDINVYTFTFGHVLNNVDLVLIRDEVLTRMIALNFDCFLEFNVSEMITYITVYYQRCGDSR